MNEQIDYLEFLRKTRPLSPHWMKQDFVNRVQLAFIYYAIEPIDPFSIHEPFEQYFQRFDKDNLWKVMEYSSLPIDLRTGLMPLSDAIDFLIEKRFEIPEHFKKPLKPSQRDETSANPEFNKLDLLEFDLTSFRPEQIQRLIARGVAALIWKKEKKINPGQRTSANEMILKPTFKDVMKSIGADKTDPTTQSEWISNQSPRSKKNSS